MKFIYSMSIDNYDWSGNAFSYGLLVARLGYEKEHLHHENVKELQLQDNSEKTGRELTPSSTITCNLAFALHTSTVDARTALPFDFQPCTTEHQGGISNSRLVESEPGYTQCTGTRTIRMKL